MDQRIVQTHFSSRTGHTVVYLMSRDQRVADNHALHAAQERAMRERRPLVVVFDLYRGGGRRAFEHYAFMLRGLEQVAADLDELGIRFVLTARDTDRSVDAALAALRPAALYCDFSPLRAPRQRAQRLARQLDVSTYVVDTHNIVPTWVASGRQEFAAHTFRRAIHRHLSTFLVEPPRMVAHRWVDETPFRGISFEDAWERVEALPRRGIEVEYEPGERAARAHLADFIRTGLSRYALGRNDIAEDQQSGLSPYLHFGQLSSLRVAVDVLDAVGRPPLLFEEARMASSGPAPTSEDGMNALFEEMIVRKELSDNFCFHNEAYDSVSSAPEWARTTLAEHAADPREYVYTLDQLRRGDTHDPVWNAAQTELVTAGKIHGYMRMYWAKKILEWSPSAADAVAYALELNDSYSIDGGDPNGFVGVLWSIAGLHDRPWAERSVFGTVRYMNHAGLKRKFDVGSYIERVDRSGRLAF
jgi:deoxyribodipyrimidine photo-lyase